MKKGMIYIMVSFFIFFSCLINVSAEWAGNPNTPSPGATPVAKTKECQEYEGKIDCNGGVSESNIRTMCERLKDKCYASKYATETFPDCKEGCQVKMSECSRNLCVAQCKQAGLKKIKAAALDSSRWKQLELTNIEKKLLDAAKSDSEVCDKKTKEEYENYKESLKTPDPEENKNLWDNLFKGSQATNKCGNVLSDRALKLLVQVYKTITQLAMVVVIILGMLDFFKATSLDDADAMKKVWQKFIKRLASVILLVMLPFILEFILSVFGDDMMKTCLDQFH